MLYASDGPCKDAELSIRTVEIQFLSCTCPFGFQVSRMNNTICTCECHSDINQYAEQCDSHTESKSPSQELGFPTLTTPTSLAF